MRFFIGGYSADLHLADIDLSSGGMRVLTSVRTPANASFLAWVAETGMLYASVETGATAAESGSLAAFRLDDDGGLTLVAEADSCGAAPCHLSVDRKNHLIIAANYTSGSVVVYSLTDAGAFGKRLSCIQHEGQGPNPARQEAAHAHSAHIDPEGKAVYVCDLGIDAVVRYELSELGAGRGAGVTVLKLRPGSGPRHLSFSDDGRNVYVITELANTVLACTRDAHTGLLNPTQEIPLLPEGQQVEAFAAEIQLHPSGRYLYASVRGPDLIAVFDRNPDTGELVPAGSFHTGGSWPRHFQIDESGSHLLVANERGNRVCLFAIEQSTGMATDSGASLEVEAPSCVLFPGETHPHRRVS
ncbi:MAG: lactonase family protein [Spirochaetaceae bacterium]|nr:MAG: lactonase family protein [Spirochaetaceae bacterium]